MFFFFNDTATTEIYTLSLHDALPICVRRTIALEYSMGNQAVRRALGLDLLARLAERSEEHTSELQSRLHLVCRLLLEKKKTRRNRQRAGRRHIYHHNLLYSPPSTTPA